MSNGPYGSGNRWWEIRGTSQPEEDEGGYRELMTDSRGRSRPERSLSVGADLAEEPRHPARAFLWPVVSAVAAVGLVLSVGYVVSTGKHSRSENAVPAPPPVRGSAPGNTDPKPDVVAQPTQPDRGSTQFAPPPRSGPLATSDDTRPPPRPPAAAPRGPAIPPGAPARNPEPISPPSGNPDDASGDSGNQPTRTPTTTTTTPAQDQPVKLDDPVPPAPSSVRVRTLKSDTGGGCARSDNTYYVCTITREAPYYLPGTTEPSSHLASSQPPWFQCQSEGPKYPGANGVNHWWAWLTPPVIVGISTSGWVPVLFLKGALSGDKPVPGLPLCDGASEPATESTGSGAATRAPTSTTAPRAKSTESAPATSAKHP